MVGVLSDLGGVERPKLKDRRFVKAAREWSTAEIAAAAFGAAESTVKVLDASKKDVLRDLQRAPSAQDSALYRAIYSRELDTFGGDPFGCLVADYSWKRGPEDAELLEKLAVIASAAAAPLLIEVGPEWLDLESWDDLNPEFKVDWAEGIGWNALRGSDDAAWAFTFRRGVDKAPVAKGGGPSLAEMLQVGDLDHRMRALLRERVKSGSRDEFERLVKEALVELGGEGRLARVPEGVLVTFPVGIRRVFGSPHLERLDSAPVAIGEQAPIGRVIVLSRVLSELGPAKDGKPHAIKRPDGALWCDAVVAARGLRIRSAADFDAGRLAEQIPELRTLLAMRDEIFAALRYAGVSIARSRTTDVKALASRMKALDAGIAALAASVTQDEVVRRLEAACRGISRLAAELPARVELMECRVPWDGASLRALAPFARGENGPTVFVMDGVADFDVLESFLRTMADRKAVVVWEGDVYVEAARVMRATSTPAPGY